MKTKKYFFLLVLISISILYILVKRNLSIEENIPQGAKALIKAYPNFSLRYKNNQIIFQDGTAFCYDDGKEKTFQEKVDNPDLEDMFSVNYCRTAPNFQEDGGRVRNVKFFKKLYGARKEEVEKHLVCIDWFGDTLLVSSINGIDKRLTKLVS